VPVRLLPVAGHLWEANEIPVRCYALTTGLRVPCPTPDAFVTPTAHTVQTVALHPVPKPGHLTVVVAFSEANLAYDVFTWRNGSWVRCRLTR
jgi:hypothetical protein